MSRTDRVLSATEAADRIAARGRQASDRRRAVYTCENCGAHTFIVAQSRDEQKEQCLSIPCRCDAGEEVAATRTLLVTAHITTEGILSPDHRVTDEETTESEFEEEEVESQIVCQRCYRKARDASWQTDEESPFIEVEGSSLTDVTCEGCGHEIEFGYSHPEGGRIWPGFQLVAHVAGRAIRGRLEASRLATAREVNSREVRSWVCSAA